jgi:hypothetical protein
MAYKVFVIATPKDGDLAVELTRRLEKAGIEVLSKRFHANGAIDDRHRKKLGASDEVFILLTDDSLNNERVTVLLGAALGLHKRVTAILVGVREQELPSIIRGIRRLNYLDVVEYISELQSRSEKILV